MGRVATTITQQIEKLESRGLIIDDLQLAETTLATIGYYRLGFYCFVFYESIEDEEDEHKFIDGVKFSDIGLLYQYDNELRHLLLDRLEDFEVHFRTQLVYQISNKYIDKPAWYVDTTIVNRNYVNSFDGKAYKDMKKKKSVIKSHHIKYPQDRYAPAWKTLEFLSLGSIVELYKSLKKNRDKQGIASYFGVTSLRTFEGYIKAMTRLRNQCAHGGMLYSYKSPDSFRRIPEIWPEINRPISKLIDLIRLLDYLNQKVNTDNSTTALYAINKLSESYSENQLLNTLLEEEELK